MDSNNWTFFHGGESDFGPRGTNLCSVVSHGQPFLGRVKNNTIATRICTATWMTYSGAKPPYRKDSLSENDAIGEELSE
ncbi:hypothetical protein CYLTODRAFT_458248 [Cylindrobasidium torrendii FP15055 ss-10]|uniref:Uncharacterized protein n=1 Tax=Cylindrobasidium torrendii FP15055 ss-10 TaxID=1314674 RepID=A0A0D7AYI3_9AGAR|nr:hypothetical protein CYLTODRAFT_458248 [Cylindrobasidium torrendii FP15055 ss-10]